MIQVIPDIWSKRNRKFTERQKAFHKFFDQTKLGTRLFFGSFLQI